MYDNLNNYRIFYTVASTGNISRAADILYISQPAISKAIARLEEGLNATLFLRNSRGVSLTDEGKILFNHIKKAFDNINQGEEELKKINDLGIGHLKIGVSTSLCKHILLDYLKDFINLNPHIEVTIRCHSTLNTINLLSEGEIDLGLICETDIPRGFTFKKLTTIHDIFVASYSYLDNLKLREMDDSSKNTDYPWVFSGNLTSLIDDNRSPKRKNLSVKDILEKSNLMLLEKNNVTRTHIDNYLNYKGIYPNRILEVNNMDLLIDFASIGMGVASVVREFAMDYIISGQITELLLDTPIEERNVGFVYSANAQKSNALTNFLEFCESIAATKSEN